jgi:hypothetical protein
MADEKPKADKPAESSGPKDPFIELVEWIFVLFLITSLLNGVVNTLGGGSLVGRLLKGDVSALSLSNLAQSTYRPLASALSVVGGRTAVISQTASVYNEAGGKEIGTQPINAKGTVVSGPVTVLGEKYWYVNFDDGALGWVKESDLGYVETTTRTLTSTEEKGTHVRIAKKTDVLSDDDKVIGTQYEKATGVILDGPRTIQGKEYYKVDFDTGVDGWVSKDNLVAVQDVSPGFNAFLLFLFGRLALWFKYLLWLVVAGLIVFLLYIVFRTGKVQKEVHEKFHPVQTASVEATTPVNQSWKRIQGYIQSPQESQWRLAIIEADIMLGDLLEHLGLVGDSIGDKLKTVDKSNFRTIDLAWDAHKVRNQIAHDSSFMLTERETKRVIGLFEEVFKEFGII